MNAIECRKLTKAYQDFALDELTFSLPAGCIPVSYTHLTLPTSLSV